MNALPRCLMLCFLIILANNGWATAPQAAYDEIALVIEDLPGSCSYPGYENAVCAVHYEHLASLVPGDDSSCYTVMRVYFTDWSVLPTLQDYLERGRNLPAVFIRLFRENGGGASEEVAWIRLMNAKVAKLQNVLWRSSKLTIQGVMFVEFTFDRILWHSVASQTEFQAASVVLCAETLPPPKSSQEIEELASVPPGQVHHEHEEAIPAKE